MRKALADALIAAMAKEGIKVPEGAIKIDTPEEEMHKELGMYRQVLPVAMPTQLTKKKIAGTLWLLGASGRQIGWALSVATETAYRYVCNELRWEMPKRPKGPKQPTAISDEAAQWFYAWLREHGAGNKYAAALADEARFARATEAVRDREENKAYGLGDGATD